MKLASRHIKYGYTQQKVKEVYKTLGCNLACARKNTGLSQAEVMQIIWGSKNGARNRISEIENGKAPISLIDLLIFQDLYGQSLDYICGLSVEPELDMIASTTNHIIHQSQSLAESIIETVSEVLVNTLKDVHKSDYIALSSNVKELMKELKKLDNLPANIIDILADIISVIRIIDVKQAKNAMAIEAQKDYIKGRIDKQENHKLLTGIKQTCQLSLPLPKPSELE